MHHYIKFDFDLGYGIGLPVLIEIDLTKKEKLQQYFQKEYSDDEFISFDENYVTVNSILKSLEFFETEKPLPLDFKSEYILNILLNYFEQPFEFNEIEETEPKTIHRLTLDELRVEDFIAYAQPFLKKEQSDPTYNSAVALTRLGQDPRLFSDIEDAITSAELFGICPDCDAVMHEEGCIVCQNYESWDTNMHQHIIQLTQKLIEDNELTIPINLNKIISNFNDIDIEYNSNISEDSSIKINQENQYLIQIKNKEFDINNPKSYKNRFTIANKLGHLFLENIDKRQTIFIAGTNEQESQANDFAANLLMPKEEFIECVYNNLDKDGLCNIEAVSDYFKVSINAVKTRGKFLGVFSW